jgi:hypothetical protein
VTFQKSTTSQAAATFRRRYVISSLATDIHEIQVTGPHSVEMIKTGMKIDEIASAKRDIKKLVIDGDIASDNMIPTDWHIESYD